MASDSKKAKNAPTAADFVAWCTKNGMTISAKVRLDSHPVVCHKIGMVAQEAIEDGETLFEVPRTLLLSPQTTAIHKQLERSGPELRGESGWVPLLLSLMHEYLSPASLWRVYLDVFFDQVGKDQPFQWTSDELDRLLPPVLELAEDVKRDQDKIRREFDQLVVPFVRKNPSLFKGDADFSLYCRCVAFCMAYSFTEPSEDESDSGSDEEEKAPSIGPMMVPLADALNHNAPNNARLAFIEGTVCMVACSAIAAGEEVFNSFGALANSELLHMYGFVLEHNPHDFVRLPEKLLVSVAEEVLSAAQKKRLPSARSSSLLDAGIVLSSERILNPEEAGALLKVLFCSEEEWVQWQEDEGWEEDTGDDDSLSLAELEASPAAFVTRCCQQALEMTPPLAGASRNEEMAATLIGGQRSILTHALKALEHGTQRRLTADNKHVQPYRIFSIECDNCPLLGASSLDMSSLGEDAR